MKQPDYVWRAIKYSTALFLMTITHFVIGMTCLFAQSDGTHLQKPGPRTIAKLVRGPGGLRKCAERLGNCVVDGDQNLYLRMNLAELTRTSSVIVLGMVESQNSEYEEKVNHITTVYRIKPDQILEGEISGNVNVRIRGGRFEFPNGTTAEETTTEWKALQSGQRYAFFLTWDPNAGYLLTNSVEALFKLSTSDGKVEAIASRQVNRGPHRIVDDVKDLAPNMLTGKVQRILSSPQSDR